MPENEEWFFNRTDKKWMKVSITYEGVRGDTGRVLDIQIAEKERALHKQISKYLIPKDEYGFWERNWTWGIYGSAIAEAAAISAKSNLGMLLGAVALVGSILARRRDLVKDNEFRETHGVTGDLSIAEGLKPWTSDEAGQLAESQISKEIWIQDKNKKTWSKYNVEFGESSGQVNKINRIEEAGEWVKGEYGDFHRTLWDAITMQYGALQWGLGFSVVGMAVESGALGSGMKDMLSKYNLSPSLLGAAAFLIAGAYRRYWEERSPADITRKDIRYYPRREQA